MGRKVSDLGFAELVSIVHQVGAKTGTVVVPVDRWLPTSKACAGGGVSHAVPLSMRHVDCPDGGWSCSCDQNAALNTLVAEASAVGLGDVRRAPLHAVCALIRDAHGGICGRTSTVLDPGVYCL